jgi:hypothetical protein
MARFRFWPNLTRVFLAGFVILCSHFCVADDSSPKVTFEAKPDVLLTFSPREAVDSQIINDLAAHPDVQKAFDSLVETLTKRYMGPFDDESSKPISERIVLANLIQNLFETDKLPLGQWGQALLKPARMTELVQVEVFLEKLLQSRDAEPQWRLTTITKYNPEKLATLLLFLKEGIDYEKTRNDEVIVYRFDLSRYCEIEKGDGPAVFYVGGQKIGEAYMLVVSSDLPLLEAKLAEVARPPFVEKYLGSNGLICEMCFERSCFELALFAQSLEALTGEGEPPLWQQNLMLAIDHVRHFSMTTRDLHGQTVTNARLEVDSESTAKELADIAHGLKTLLGFGKHIILDDENEFAREIILGLADPLTVQCEGKTVNATFDWTHSKFQKLARYGVTKFLEDAKDYKFAGELYLQTLLGEGDHGMFHFNLRFNATSPGEEGNDDDSKSRENKSRQSTDVREA